jgi:hypothetical protein
LIQPTPAASEKVVQEVLHRALLASGVQEDPQAHSNQHGEHDGSGGTSKSVRGAVLDEGPSRCGKEQQVLRAHEEGKNERQAHSPQVLAWNPLSNPE